MNSSTLERHLPDGTLDPTFGSAGKVTMRYTAPVVSEMQGGPAALQADGKILVANKAYPNTFMLQRFLPNGALDRTFGVQGTAQVDVLGSSFEERAFDLVIQADGKIVHSGDSRQFFNSGGYELHAAVVRFRADGTPDPTFGDSGVFVTDRLSEAAHVAVYSDGRIALIGYTQTGSLTAAVLRLLPNGSPDQTFGSSGVQILGPSRNGIISGLAVDGASAVVAVSDFSHADNDIVVLRLTESGAPDPAFGGGAGEMRVNLSNNARDLGTGRTGLPTVDTVWDVLLAPNGAILVVGGHGETIVNNRSSPLTGAVVRLTAAGDLDATFGQGGIALVPLGANNSTVFRAAALQPDGRLVITNGAIVLRMLTNDDSVAVTDQVSVTEDGSVLIDVLSNDELAPACSGPLTIVAFQQGTHGTVTREGDGFRYTPVANYAGPDTFTYTIADGQGGTATGAVRLTVIAVNDAPTLTVPRVAIKAHSNRPLLFTGSNAVRVTDIDSATVRVTLTALNGTLRLTPAGRLVGSLTLSGAATIVNAALAGLTFVPKAGYVSAGQVTVSLENGSGGKLGAAIAVTVADVKPTRLATAKAYTARVNVKLAGTSMLSLARLFKDVDGDPLTIHLVTPPRSGTLRLSANGTFTFLSRTGGRVLFVVRAFDGALYSEPVTVALIVV